MELEFRAWSFGLGVWVLGLGFGFGIWVFCRLNTPRSGLAGPPEV